MFLYRFDDPRLSGAYVEPRGVEWKKEVQDRELVLRIFRDWDEDKYEHLVRGSLYLMLGCDSQMWFRLIVG